MTPDDSPTEAQRDEAALWLARMTGGAQTQAEHAAFEAWLAEDLRHRQAYDELRVLYAQLEGPAFRADASRSVLQKIVPHLRPRRSWLAVPLVPGLALLCIWAFNPAVLQNWEADVVTSDEIVSSFDLPDGSRALLGADTALALDFKTGHRTVYLLRGEAFFEVRHDQSADFKVIAQGNTVRDIGTKFNVNLTNAKTDIVVTEGSVEVTDQGAGNSLVLTRGEEAIVDNGPAKRVTRPDADSALAWMSGRLVVEGAPVEDVIATLRRHHRGTIILGSDFSRQIISGTFPLNDADAALATIASALHARLFHFSRLVTILY